MFQPGELINSKENCSNNVFIVLRGSIVETSTNDPGDHKRMRYTVGQIACL